VFGFRGQQAGILRDRIPREWSMTERLLLVDYENIQAVDLKKLPVDVNVRFVLGGKQEKLPTELSIQAQLMGARFTYVRIQGVQPNACDFCIAFYLGEYLQANPNSECVILSKDKKGFDPLVHHLTTERGFDVRRVNSQKEAFPADIVPQPKGDFARLTTLLKKEKNPPRKRKGLEAKVRSWFAKSSEEEINALTQRLFDEEFVREINKSLVFPWTKHADVAK
jgi:hypothetical protein